MSDRRAVFVVPHTHWDREWYEPRARLGQRLVAAVDAILDLLERGMVDRFLLDGQCILMEDYLRVRPEQWEPVARLAHEGKLLLGPWYILADELLSTDETLVRNLLEGTKLASALGNWLSIGYSPDAFGHPAALPTILSGFGIEHGILWRGYGGESGQETDLFRWEGPDGASLLVHHLPPAGYEFGANLPVQRAELERRWKAIAEVLEPRAGRRPFLLLNGADHHQPQPELAGALRELRRIVPGSDFVVASPLDYFAALTGADEAPTESGELRFSYRYTWTLQGVHSTRAGLKGAIAEGARLLVRWAEPQAALAAATGGGDRRPLLTEAWRCHLRNTFHDSFAGCTSDTVARDVATRARQATVQARGILGDALHERLGQDRSRALRQPLDWDPTLVVVNPSPADRRGVVEATLTVTRARIVVGRPAPRSTTPVRVDTPVRLVMATGTEVPMQVLARYEAHERVDSPTDYPHQDVVTAYRVALWPGWIPSLGLRAYRVVAGAPGARVRHPVRVDGDRLVMRWGTVGADPEGGFAAIMRDRERSFAGLASMESERDEGDTYTFQPVEGDRPMAARWGSVRSVYDGPLLATLARDFVIGRRARGTVYARLDAGSRLLRFIVEGTNLAGQHRLRVRFPLPDSAATDLTVADMQYGPVVRQCRRLDVRRFRREWPVAAAPMHGYVSVPGGHTVFARGLFEYELTADRAIAVTVLRAVGELSRGDLTARPGHAGWPTATPDANELGRFRAEFAVASATVGPHSTALEWDRVERMAEEFHVPLAALMLRYGIDVPRAVEGPALTGSGLVFKALKPAEEGNALILRCVNVTAEPARGVWAFPFVVTRAHRARLDETRRDEIGISADGREIAFEAGPREVVTIRVEMGHEG